MKMVGMNIASGDWGDSEIMGGVIGIEVGAEMGTHVKPEKLRIEMKKMFWQSTGFTSTDRKRSKPDQR